MSKGTKAHDDAFAQMMAFLGLGGQAFTASDRECMVRDVETIARLTAQMDGGQKGGVSFEAIPFVFTRCAVYCTKLVLSGAVDRLEVDG